MLYNNCERFSIRDIDPRTATRKGFRLEADKHSRGGRQEASMYKRKKTLALSHLSEARYAAITTTSCQRMYMHERASEAHTSYIYVCHAIICHRIVYISCNFRTYPAALSCSAWTRCSPPTSARPSGPGMPCTDEKATDNGNGQYNIGTTYRSIYTAEVTLAD